MCCIVRYINVKIVFLSVFWWRLWVGWKVDFYDGWINVGCLCSVIGEDSKFFKICNLI